MKIGRPLACLGVCDKSEIPVCRRCWPGKAGSMRPRKCASGIFPWWAQAISVVYLRRASFCVQCAVSCCVALRCAALLLLAGAERVVCLGAQMTVQGRASHDGTPATKVETVSLCPRILCRGHISRLHLSLMVSSSRRRRSQWPGGVGDGDVGS